MNNDLIRFLTAEIERLKDELAHLKVNHDKVVKSSIGNVEFFIKKIEDGTSMDKASDFLADTIDSIFKNGEMNGRIKEIKKMIKKYEANLEILEKGESEKIN